MAEWRLVLDSRTVQGHGPHRVDICESRFLGQHPAYTHDREYEGVVAAEDSQRRSRRSLDHPRWTENDQKVLREGKDRELCVCVCVCEWHFLLLVKKVTRWTQDECTAVVVVQQYWQRQSLSAAAAQKLEMTTRRRILEIMANPTKRSVGQVQ